MRKYRANIAAYACVGTRVLVTLNLTILEAMLAGQGQRCSWRVERRGWGGEKSERQKAVTGGTVNLRSF